MKQYFRKAYLYLISLQRLWRLPVVGYKLQVTELVFLVWALVSGRTVLQQLRTMRWRPLDWAVVAWPIAVALPLLYTGVDRGALLEVAGAAYLTGLYFLIRCISDQKTRAAFPRTIVIAAGIAAVLGIGGWIVFQLFGIDTPLVLVRAYPYLGETSQAKAFTASPNMLSSILMVGIVFQTSRIIGDWGKGQLVQTLVLLLLLACFVLTFSKTVVCMVVGVIVTAYLHYAGRTTIESRRRQARVVMLLLIAVCSVIYLVGSHLVISRTGSDTPAMETLRTTHYGAEPLYRFTMDQREYGVYITNYSYNKRAAMIAFMESYGMGVGPGNFNWFVGQLQERGEHPEAFPQWDPHSVYFGTLARLGIVGGAVIAALWLLVSRRLYRAVTTAGSETILIYALAGLFIAIALEATVTDMMNFRHYWWLLGVVGAHPVSR